MHNSSNEYQDVDVADPEDPTKGPVGGGADLIGTVIGIVKTVVDRMLGRGGPGVATEGEAASAAVEQSPTFVRTLTEADLGTGATVARLQGTVSLGGEKATIHIANIEGKMSNPFSVIESLKAVARAEGASTLRIEGTLANPRLKEVIEGRYELHTQGAVDWIEITLG